MAATLTATHSHTGQQMEQPSKSKSNKTNKQPATKDPKRCNWRENFSNPLLSGIEFRDIDTDELLHFTTIQRKGIQKDSAPFRITISVNDDGTFIMPRKQTFDEMIQAKRRQTNSFYHGSGHHHTTTTSSVLSDRAARRVSAAARRQSSALNTSASSRASSSRLNQPVVEVPAAPAQLLVAARSSKSSKKSKSKKKKSSRPSTSKSCTSSKSATPAKYEPLPSPPAEPEQQSSAPLYVASTSSASSISAPIPTTSATIPIPTTSTVDGSNNISISTPPFEVKTSGEDLGIIAKNRPVQMISSMKELARQNPSLGSIDKKEIKRLLKIAPPGTAIVLSNGTVIKKSRRGGARAGAGRKRSRPLPNGTQPSSSNTSFAGAQQQDSRSSLTNMSTSSGDQTILANNTNTSAESAGATPSH